MHPTCAEEIIGWVVGGCQLRKMMSLDQRVVFLSDFVL